MEEKKPRDPRIWQIAALSGLLVYGVTRLNFDVDPWTAVTLLATALGVQWVATWVWKLPRFEAKSALISSLSLCLLLRAASPFDAALVATIAILSKFLIRARGKHIFNPTNFGLVVGLLLLPGVWVSPGQWGTAAVAGFFLASIGVFVVHRSRRSDVTWAFLTAWASILCARAAWLGDPLAIPLHQLQSGALLIFAFFMISDPKTTPDSRAGRVLWASGIALFAAYWQFVLYRPNGLLFALVLSAPAVPLLDRWLPGHRYAWGERRRAAGSARVGVLPAAPSSTRVAPTVTGSTALRSTVPNPTVPDSTLSTSKRNVTMIFKTLVRKIRPRISRQIPSLLLTCAVVGAALFHGAPASAFCGFYVAKAETDLYNRASKVVIVRDGDRTVLTMVNDYEGAPEEFAMVIPVPTLLREDQIHVGDRAVIDHLDAYTAPRLVEYFDPDPCRPVGRFLADGVAAMESASPASGARRERRAKSLGVRVEASYSIGEYDIVILSAKQSHGLETFLREEGYRLPEGAEPVLASYLKQGMRFFVAKVNLEAQGRLGFSELRPLQMAFESPKFMLPVRLGTVNAKGPQELFVWLLTRTGRVEPTNYRTVRLPSNVEIPEFVEEDFGGFYRDLFAHQAEKEKRRAVFLEYAWDMAWCDPCAADPLSSDELRRLGVFWLGDGQGPVTRRSAPQPRQDVFVTRLHMSYTADSFPEDLVFQETKDRENFQGRYILRRPFDVAGASCPAAETYRGDLAKRREQEAQRLANLTGRPIGEIRRQMALVAPAAEESSSWWRRLWSDS